MSLWDEYSESFTYPNGRQIIHYDDAQRTVAHARTLRRVGLKVRRGRIPRQIYPKTIEMEYAKAMILHIDRAKHALTPLNDALAGLIASARAERGDRFDANETSRVRELIGKARDALTQATRPSEVETLATSFGMRTQAFNKVQLGRQVRAALGADVFASDHRINTILDHFVSENVALIKSIPSQVVDQIEGIVNRGFTNGMLSSDLAEEIDRRFDVGESRARLIARDQVGKLYGQTNAYRQQDLGITAFIWRTAGDERVREEHADLDGEQFDYDDLPDEGLPGEPIQCRCYAEPVFDNLRDDVDAPEPSDDAPADNGNDVET